MARRGVSIGALPEPSDMSQVRCAPVYRPSRSVTAAITRRPNPSCDLTAAWQVTDVFRAGSAKLLTRQYSSVKRILFLM